MIYLIHLHVVEKKNVGSLSNLKKVLCNEGFDNIFVRYMGEYGFYLNSITLRPKNYFGTCRLWGLGFPVYTSRVYDFTPEGRIACKIQVHWIRAKEATDWIPEFSEDEEDDDHSKQEFISREQSDLGLHIDGEGNGASEVPETFFENSDGMKESLKYPPGFTPSVEKNGSKSKDDQVQNISDNQLNGDNEFVHQVEREDNRNSDGAKTNSTGSRKFKMSEIPRTDGSILSVMEEIVK
ncbi:hypothetical protein Tco_1380237, partial [Tanacetum coccineum]